MPSWRRAMDSAIMPQRRCAQRYQEAAEGGGAKDNNFCELRVLVCQAYDISRDQLNFFK